MIAGRGYGLAVGCPFAGLVTKLEPISSLCIIVELTVILSSISGARFQIFRLSLSVEPDFGFLNGYSVLGEKLLIWFVYTWCISPDSSRHVGCR